MRLSFWAERRTEEDLHSSSNDHEDLSVVANRNGLSAMIFAVHRSPFSGERLAITARDVIPTSNSLRM